MVCINLTIVLISHSTKVCAKIMQQGVVPPTINLENPDLEAGCDLDYVPNVAHRYATKEDIPTAILSDNLGFGESVVYEL